MNKSYSSGQEQIPADHFSSRKLGIVKDTESRDNEPQFYQKEEQSNSDMNDQSSDNVNDINANDQSHNSERMSGPGVTVQKNYQMNPWQNGDRRGRLAKFHKNEEILQIEEIVIDEEIQDFRDKNERIV